MYLPNYIYYPKKGIHYTCSDWKSSGQKVKYKKINIIVKPLTHLLHSESKIQHNYQF